MKRKTLVFLVTAMFTLTGCSQQNDTTSDIKINFDANQSSIQETDKSSLSEISTQQNTSTTENTTDVYYQSYPVQAYQRAYAELLNSLELNYEAYMLHIDEDLTPELVVIQDLSEAMLYSFDGDKTYEVGCIGLDYYTYNFYYRPYFGMVSYSIGSLMNGEHHRVVQTIVKENDRLKIDQTIHFAAKDNTELECEFDHLTKFEDTTPYDIGFNGNSILGESWKVIDEEYLVTDSKIQCWIQ